MAKQIKKIESSVTLQTNGYMNLKVRRNINSEIAKVEIIFKQRRHVHQQNYESRHYPMTKKQIIIVPI